MHDTPLHHKPVFYGSELADELFIALLAFHAVVAAIALFSGIFAIASKKGGPLHRKSGATFVYSMIATAVTGAAVGVIRLSVFVEPNHTDYLETSMPSSYPARIAFLYAAACIVFLAWDVRSRMSRPRPEHKLVWLMPAALVLLGAGATAYIIVRLDPYTGALFMIITFMLVISVLGYLRVKSDGTRASRVREHAFVMLTLAAFSWWGAAQGFGPALGQLLSPPEPTISQYVGDQRGVMRPQILFFLAFWAPAFLIAAALFARFRRRARRLRPSAA